MMLVARQDPGEAFFLPSSVWLASKVVKYSVGRGQLICSHMNCVQT